MECPYCHHDKTRVLETRPTGQGVDRRRRRKCESCTRTFATVEHVTGEELTVAKRDGRIERFERSKLLASINKAAFVHPIPVGAMSEIVEGVTFELTEESSRTSGHPTSTPRIGELVLKYLARSTHAQDGVRIRYAMVLENKKGSEPQLTGSENVINWLERTFPRSIDKSFRRGTRVVKRTTGAHEDFDRDRLIKSIEIVTDCGRTEEEAHKLATHIARRVERQLESQKLVTSQQVAVELLNILRDEDSIAYLRYASAVKQLRMPQDFYQEAIEQRQHEEEG